MINVDKLTSFSSIWLHCVTLTVYERSRDLRPVLLSWLSRLEKEELKVETVQTCHRVSNLLHDDELAPRSLGFHQGVVKLEPLYFTWSYLISLKILFEAKAASKSWDRVQ